MREKKAPLASTHMLRVMRTVKLLGPASQATAIPNKTPDFFFSFACVCVWES